MNEKTKQFLSIAKRLKICNNYDDVFHKLKAQAEILKKESRPALRIEREVEFLIAEVDRIAGTSEYFRN